MEYEEQIEMNLRSQQHQQKSVGKLVTQSEPSVEEEDRDKYNHNVQDQPEKNLADIYGVEGIIRANYRASHSNKEIFEAHSHHIASQSAQRKISSPYHHHITGLQAFFKQKDANDFSSSEYVYQMKAHTLPICLF